MNSAGDSEESSHSKFPLRTSPGPHSPTLTTGPHRRNHRLHLVLAGGAVELIESAVFLAPCEALC